jgi:HSP20 family protein
MNWRTARYFVPPTDIVELADRLVVMVEIAGMNADDFNITLMNRTLIVSGVRRRDVMEFTTYHQLEIGYGQFRVEINLPWMADSEQVNATYRDGLLQIELPRRADRQIPVVDRGANERLEIANE